MSWDKLPQLNVLVKGKWSLILEFLSMRVGGSTALDTFFQMDDNAKGELLKRLMAHNVMGGGRQFLANSLLFLELSETPLESGCLQAARLHSCD